MNQQFYDLSQEKQLRIINAGLEVFSRSEYKHAVTDDIARKAGISKGLLFYYFKNKKSLYLYLFEYCSNLIINQVMNEHLARFTDFFDLLEYTMEEKLKLMERTPYLMEFLMRTFYSNKEAFSDEINWFLADVNSQALSDCLKQIDRSRFCDDITPEEVCAMLTWMAQGYLNERQRMNMHISIQEVMGVYRQWVRRMKQMAYRPEYQE